MSDYYDYINKKPLHDKDEEVKKLKEEIESLKVQLNNSKNFHCEHFLTNDSGTISCQVKEMGHKSYKQITDELTRNNQILHESVKASKRLLATSSRLAKITNYLALKRKKEITRLRSIIKDMAVMITLPPQRQADIMIEVMKITGDIR